MKLLSPVGFLAGDGDLDSTDLDGEVATLSGDVR